MCFLKLILKRCMDGPTCICIQAAVRETLSPSVNYKGHRKTYYRQAV